MPGGPSLRHIQLSRRQSRSFHDRSVKARSTNGAEIIWDVSNGKVVRQFNNPKVKRYLRSASGEIEAVLTSLALNAFWVEDQGLTSPIIAADPSDDVYLLAAAEGEADFVVSGDRHLLALRKFEGIPILTPREFLGKLE